jgi:hypothetical protein
MQQAPPKLVKMYNSTLFHNPENPNPRYAFTIFCLVLKERNITQQNAM